jgi:myo-inositol catabolism protein IolC
MPVEKSGQDEFDFQYGEEFGEHIEAFDPSFSKVLVRYNPEGDGEMNRRQAERLARLARWLHENDRRFLFELLVPAEPDQLERVGGDTDRYDRELRPDLMIAAIGELQGAGVEPDVWKIEGLDSSEDCVRVAEAARVNGRDEVSCVVLGRGGNEEKVAEWIRTGAGVPGYVGFAVGRTIWWDPLSDWLGGGDADEAAATIAANYRRLIDVYTSAAVG